MKPLTEAELAHVLKVLATKTFEEAVRLLPGGVRDLFDTDMFPEGLTPPLSPAERAKLDADVEREYQALKHRRRRKLRRHR